MNFSPYGKEAQQRHKLLESYVQRIPPPEPIVNHFPTVIKKTSRSRCTCGQLTNVFCHECDMFLCFTQSRNCFTKFHIGLPLEHLPEFSRQPSRSRCQCGELTFVQCTKCKVFLCFNQTRNCFQKYHEIQ